MIFPLFEFEDIGLKHITDDSKPVFQYYIGI